MAIRCTSLLGVNSIIAHEVAQYQEQGHGSNECHRCVFVNSVLEVGRRTNLVWCLWNLEASLMTEGTTALANVCVERGQKVGHLTKNVYA